MKKLTLWMLTALAVLGIGGLTTACSGESDENDANGGKATIVSKEYKEYLSASGLRSDAQQLAELAAHEKLLELLFIKMESGDWKKPLFSTYDYSDATMKRYLEVLGEAVEHADEYEAAVKRLSASQALGTNSPKTRGFDNIPFYTAVKLTGYLKLSGKACRAAIVGVITDSGHANDNAWLKERCNFIDPAHMRGCKDYVDFWQKFSRGELDDRACTIFGNIMSSDPEFKEVAADLGVTRGGTIRSVAVPMITAGVNIVLNLTPATTIAAETMEIGSNLSNLVDSVKSGGSVGGTLVKTVSSIAKTAYNHCGKAPVDGGNKFYGDIMENAQKELILGGAGDAEDVIAKSIENLVLGSGKTSGNEETELLKDGGKAKVTFTDKDKKTPAQVVVATDKDGKSIGLGTPDDKGKATVVVPGGTNVAVTAVDRNGDKHTEQTNVPKGQTTDIEAETNESENIEVAPQLEKPSISSKTTALNFDADGGQQTFTVTYKGLFIAAAVMEDEAEAWCSVDVDAKGKVTVTVKPNDGTERTCTVDVGAWNDDDAEDMEIVEVTIVQSGIAGDLSFIDWKKFRIDGLKDIHVDVMDKNSDYLAEFNKPLRESFVFPNKSLTIKKVSDSEYQVIGICSDDTRYDKGNTPDADHCINPDSPYGIHYEVSFRVVAMEPSILIKADNFGLKDIRLKGFYKTIHQEYGDALYEFDYYFEETGCDSFEFGYGNNPGKQCQQNLVSGKKYNPYSELNWKKNHWDWHTATGENGESVKIWEFKSDSYKLKAESQTSSAIEMTLRWD